MNELKQKKALLNPPTFNQMLLGPEQAGKASIFNHLHREEDTSPKLRSKSYYLISDLIDHIKHGVFPGRVVYLALSSNNNNIVEMDHYTKEPIELSIPQDSELYREVSNAISNNTLSTLDSQYKEALLRITLRKPEYEFCLVSDFKNQSLANNQIGFGFEKDKDKDKDTISYKIKSYTYPLPFEKKSRLYSILFEAIQSNALSTLPLQDKVEIIDYVVEKKVYSFQLISDFFKSALSSSDFVGFDLAPNQDNILYVSSFTQGNIVEFEINKNLNLYSVLVEMIESSWQMNSNPLIHSIKIL